MSIEELVLELQALQQSHSDAPVVFVSANGAHKYSRCTMSVTEDGSIVVRLQDNVVKKK